MGIVLIDASSSSLTVSWPPTEGATRYVLEYRIAGNDDSDFILLSDKLSMPQARKRNLSDTPLGYSFRAGAIVGNDDGSAVKNWVTHPEPFKLLSKEEESKCMETPTVVPAGSNQALLISWKAVDGASGYELQMREDVGGHEWKTIAPSLSGTEVRKKNLTSKYGYQFRVRPSGQQENSLMVPFSPPSDTVIARGLSVGIQRFFIHLEDGTLLRSGQKEKFPLADALGGKEFVLLYASAHWCPPCRQFTPKLATWYQSVRSYVEVIFLSCDHDEQGFQSYFATHPWMAVDFEDDAREQIIGAIKVSGIPRLVVMSGLTGKILVDNAVGQPFDLNQWRILAAK